MNSENPTLAEAGELAFIDRIRHLIDGAHDNIEHSIGDDCLVTRPIGDQSVLVTTDSFVETVHFDRALSGFHDIGRRCMAASVSDIAAMAAEPLCALTALSLPGSMALDDAVALFDGLAEEAASYGCPVSGGETTSTPGPATVTVTVLGSAATGAPVLRSGAHVGDGIYVTGTIGDAMAGLAALMDGTQGYGGLKRKFITPHARVSTALALAATYRLNAMIDISDGVATDMGHITSESGCGAFIEGDRIPMSREFIDFMSARGADAIEHALTSGEEFELLFTSDDASMPDTFSIDDVQITRIGTVTEAASGITLLRHDGSSIPLTSRGYEHFKS